MKPGNKVKMEALCMASEWALGGFYLHDPNVRKAFTKAAGSRPELLSLVEHTADKIAIWYNAGCPKTAPENLVTNFEKHTPLLRCALEYMFNSLATSSPPLRNYAKSICTDDRESKSPRAFLLTGNPAQPLVYIGDALYVLNHRRVMEPMLAKTLVWFYF